MSIKFEYPKSTDLVKATLERHQVFGLGATEADAVADLERRIQDVVEEFERGRFQFSLGLSAIPQDADKPING